MLISRAPSPADVGTPLPSHWAAAHVPDTGDEAIRASTERVTRTGTTNPTVN